MDYEKKYKEALERARQFSEKPYLEDSKGIVDYIFPELKESEDERIRKYLKRIIGEWSYDDLFAKGFRKEDIIAWLEKKVEQKPQRMVSAEAKEAMYNKPAWSEEDEENLNWFEKFFRAESVIAEGKDIPQDRYMWFKNLKNRVQPMHTWKPSDEQMKALKHASNDCSIAFADMKILSTLYEQLKALHRYEQDT